jgi:hypothetical protein
VTKYLRIHTKYCPWESRITWKHTVCFLFKNEKHRKIIQKGQIPAVSNMFFDATCCMFQMCLACWRHSVKHADLILMPHFCYNVYNKSSSDLFQMHETPWDLSLLFYPYFRSFYHTCLCKIFLLLRHMKFALGSTDSTFKHFFLVKFFVCLKIKWCNTTETIWNYTNYDPKWQI